MGLSQMMKERNIKKSKVPISSLKKAKKLNCKSLYFGAMSI